MPNKTRKLNTIRLKARVMKGERRPFTSDQRLQKESYFSVKAQIDLFFKCRLYSKHICLILNQLITLGKQK